MKRLLIILTFLPFLAMSQQKAKTNVYLKSASEFIFSLGNVEAYSDPFKINEINTDPILRFSGFFHLQEQIHFDFTRSFGIFTGIGVRNIGMINELNDSVKVKQRVYSLGIPLAFKLGKLPGGFYVSAGGEGELFFHYKQKVYYDDDKRKTGEWFSDRVNLLNPSVFLDINSGKGSYIRFKYYLNDFLVNGEQKIKISNSEVMPYFPEKSQLFYIAIGSTIRHKSTPSPKYPPGTPTKRSGKKRDNMAWYTN